MAGASRSGVWRQRALVVLAPVPALLCAARLAGLWDCTTACAGGGHYERAAGVSTLVLALPVYGALAAWIWRDAWRGARSAAVDLAAWLLVGVSVFFVSILARLDLWCPHCLAVHATVLALALSIAPQAITWRARLLAMLIGALSANATFHHRPVIDVMEPDRLPPTVPTTAQSGSEDIRPVIEANRSLGAVAAPWRLDLAIDHYCPHCAEAHAGLMKALAPLAGDHLRIVTRHVVRPSAPRGAELARHALAAAAIDRPTFTALTAVLLGTRPDQSWPGVRAFAADVVDAVAIEAMELRHREVLAGMVKQDLRELRERGIGASTPALALVAADGRTVRRWDEAVEVSKIAAEVRRIIAP